MKCYFYFDFWFAGEQGTVFDSPDVIENDNFTD